MCFADFDERCDVVKKGSTGFQASDWNSRRMGFKPTMSQMNRAEWAWEPPTDGSNSRWVGLKTAVINPNSRRVGLNQAGELRERFTLCALNSPQ